MPCSMDCGLSKGPLFSRATASDDYPETDSTMRVDHLFRMDVIVDAQIKQPGRKGSHNL